MLIFYRAARAIACRRREQQLLQQPEMFVLDDRIVNQMQPATKRTVEHPLRQLNRPTAFRFFQSAPDDRAKLALHPFRDNDTAAVPRVPRITDFMDVATVGFLLPGCTTPSGRTARWAIGPQHRKRPSRGLQLPLRSSCRPRLKNRSRKL
jgi:hypothetical protein